MLTRYLTRTLLVLTLAVLAAAPAESDTVNTNNLKEQFNGTTTNYSWLAFNGACLTASTASKAVGASTLAGCLNTAYYQSQVQVGGANGYLGTSGSGTAPSSSSGQSADPSGQGALRLTNGYTSGASSTFQYGFNQNGAILSNFSFPSTNGIQVQFTTVTYEGNSGGNGGSGTVNAKDGADGISFFLVDDLAIGQSYNTPLDSGAFGGSLGYTCSNTNNDSTLRSDSSQRGYDGLVGGYIGLGIDEYGNFLNPGDNTASGPGLQANRIGLRGAGSISWKWLNTQYPNNYPSSWSGSNQRTAVKNTCASGYLQDYNGNYYTSTGTSPTTSSHSTNGIQVKDYAMITDSAGNGAFQVLSGVKIANESATTRAAASPITYSLKITQDGYLTFSYSYNGGSWQPVLTNTLISNQNGTIPANLRFGFAGSTGGSTNVHEILCFNAQQIENSGSSGGVNVYQNPTIKSNTQVFLADYFPSNWTGQLTAQQLVFDTTNNIIKLGSVNWDASCVLTGGSCTSTGATGVTAQSILGSAGGGVGRQMLTWDRANSVGIPFEWPATGSTGITSAMQSTIDSGDATPLNGNRVNFIRGDRTNEIPKGTSQFRTRVGVLGDIVDSSPTWVGPPQTYDTQVNFVDATNPTGSATESANPYSTFTSNYQSRLNVVYVGANDGFLHGFRAGTMDSKGNLNTTNNDGTEVLAYMPATVFQAIHNTSNNQLDYAGTNYSHNWYVDATPGVGDVYYASPKNTQNGPWHTWLVGGLGAGGAAIYILDVTDPSASNFVEGNASSLVIGEYTPANITCATTTANPSSAGSCGNNMGNTYGTPLIRRFHNGRWGAIFGNGYGSKNGTAGIFIMLISPTDSSRTFYYLPTGSATTGNGIGPTTSADLDLDHIVDYVYAGDLKGNVWRFDVTNADPTKWAVSATSPIFSTGGQPITTALTVSTLKTILTKVSLTGRVLDSLPERVIINFGTGQQIPQSLTAAAQFQTTQQTLYGLWDWDMAAWNTISPGQQAIYLPTTGSPKGVTPIPSSQLQVQTITNKTANGVNYRQMSQNAVCWMPSPNQTTPDDSSCSSAGSNMFGWYTQLPVSNGLAEQVIFDPTVNADGMLIVNTYVPANNSPLQCTPQQATGFSMAVQPDSGQGAPTGGYFLLAGGQMADGLQLNGIGTPSFVSSGLAADSNSEYIVTQTANGMATPTKVNRHILVAGQRLNWIQRR